MRWILLLTLASSCWAQQAAAHAERVRAAMQPSLAKQRVSLALQAEGRPPRSTLGPLRAGCAPVALPELAQMVGTAARENDIDPKLIREVARQESAFHPCAVSSKGAQGLMQLMPATQALLDVRDPFNPQENLAAGARLLKELLLRYNGNLSLALSAYNAGPARVDPIQRIPPIPETWNYVTNILSRLEH